MGSKGHTTMTIIKAQPTSLAIKRIPNADLRELYVAYMLMCFMRAPARKTGPGEIVDLGEIGSVPEKTWERLNSYAVATPK